MKKETLKKRIYSELVTKSGKIRDKYRMAIAMITEPNAGRWHLTHWSNKGRSLSDHRPDTREALELIGIDYELGNDAPCGGRNGDYIALTAKGRRQVKEFASAYKYDYYAMIAPRN